MVAIGLSLFLGLFLLFKDISGNNASFSANFADNILRPILGNTMTIKLESVLFNTQDTVKQITANINGDKTAINLASMNKLQWTPTIEDKKDNFSPIIETTLYYPDKQRPYAQVHLVKVDINKVSIGAVAGIKEPASEVGMPGPGIVPVEIKNSNRLIAAFNGGFQYRDGQYGMMVGKTVYLPLQEGLATLLVDTKGKVTIEQYSSLINVNNYVLARQNGEMLVKNGMVIPSSKDKLASVWGRSVTSSMYTWRSGLGINSKGDLIYAVGNSLIPETLGEALKTAGAINAMQLDINPFWVRFSLFKPISTGVYEHQSLFPKMYDGGKEFLSGDKKDFFYLTLKTALLHSDVTIKNTVNGWTTN